MKFYLKQSVLIIVFFMTSNVSVLAGQTEEMLAIMNQAMLEPCNSQAYLSCLGLEQAFCRKQVGISVDLCNKKFPLTAMGENKQQFFQEFGTCMQREIVGHLKLTSTMLEKCEPVLKANLPQG